MRILILAALASWARPAAGFATTPSDPIYAENLINAFVAMSLLNCNADEIETHKGLVETAATDLVEDMDANSNGILTEGELEEYRRMEAGSEAIDVAEAAQANPPTNKCVIGAILPLVRGAHTTSVKYTTSLKSLPKIVNDDDTMIGQLLDVINYRKNDILVAGAAKLNMHYLKLYLIHFALMN